MPEGTVQRRTRHMSTLEIKDLHVSIDTEQGTKEILKGVSLTLSLIHI